MSVEFFFDTNVLIYAFQPAQDPRHAEARRLWALAIRAGKGGISFQVIQEFIHVAVKKFRPALKPEQLREIVSKSLIPICRVHPNASFYLDALDTHHLSGFSWYDSLILQAAVDAGCRTLYSEDLQDGYHYRGVTVKNPFRA